MLIEDTRELQCPAPSLVALRTKDGTALRSNLVRSSQRLRPGRIPIGEALDLLKAWGTGHPEALERCTQLQNRALRRLEQLIQEAVATVPRALVAEIIDLIAVLDRGGFARRRTELATVGGLSPSGTTSLFKLRNHWFIQQAMP